MRLRTVAASLVILLVAGALAGCSDTIHGKEFAEPTVERFRALMKAGDYEKVYESTGTEFRAATNREKGIALFAAVGRKLGQLKSAEQVNWNVNTRNGTTTAVLVYSSKYEAGDAIETFTVIVDDEKGRLVGYNINSLDMLIK